MYDPMMVKPMREEVTRAGVRELLTPDDVEAVLKSNITSTLIFINSVCGCAAGSARPALINALKKATTKPSVIATVFAGMERDATDRVRKHMVGYPPSSPSFGIFRNGEIVHMVQRHDIEGQSADDVAQILVSTFEKYCGNEVKNEAKIYNPRTANQISVQETAQRLKAGAKLIDVRDEYEASMAKINGGELLTEEFFAQMQKQWPPNTEIICYCHHGVRSLQAVSFLKKHGFTNVKSMAGGIDAWSQTMDSSVPRY